MLFYKIKFYIDHAYHAEQEDIARHLGEAKLLV